jgi:uncharacterized protein YijF (DUF1287 family)
VAGNAVEQPLGVGLGQLGVVEGGGRHDGRPAVVGGHVVGRAVQEQQVDVLNRLRP